MKKGIIDFAITATFVAMAMMLFSCERQCYYSCSVIAEEIIILPDTVTIEQLSKLPLVLDCEDVKGVQFDVKIDTICMMPDSIVIHKGYIRCLPRP